MKTLQEIQKENRELIIKNWDSDRLYDSEIYNLNLSRTLLAIDDKLGLLDRIMLADQELTIPFIDEYGHNQSIDWDLRKETLEQQGEETQRIVNELLINPKQ